MWVGEMEKRNNEKVLWIKIMIEVAKCPKSRKREKLLRSKHVHKRHREQLTRFTLCPSTVANMRSSETMWLCASE